MRKIAWSAAIGCVAAYAAVAANVGPRSIAEQPVPAFSAETTCPSTPTPGPACAADVADAETMADELGALIDSAPPAAGWASQPAAPGAALGFQDTAAEASAGPSTVPDGETSHRLIPALLAMGGLLVLLRKRPT